MPKQRNTISCTPRMTVRHCGLTNGVLTTGTGGAAMVGVGVLLAVPPRGANNPNPSRSGRTPGIRRFAVPVEPPGTVVVVRWGQGTGGNSAPGLFGLFGGRAAGDGGMGGPAESKLGSATAGGGGDGGSTPSGQAGNGGAGCYAKAELDATAGDGGNDGAAGSESP